MTRPALLSFALLFTATAAAAQQPAATLSTDQIAALARLDLAIGKARDSIVAQLVQQRNKKDDQQAELRGKLATQVAAVLAQAQLPEPEYRHRMFVIASDNNARRIFDSVTAVLTGAPIPIAAKAAAAVALPAGPVGTHLGHIVNSFTDTPNRQALLATALTEARTAAQHAQLASRQPANLDYMKTHVNHVINALDPIVVAAGPGLGYGVKRAATGVAGHIEAAAATAGASANVQMHAKHIATCSRNAVQRAESIITLGQRVLAATTAQDAAGLVSQIASLADALLNGADANNDGRITADPNECGLVAADDHMKLLLAAEKP
jgi:hypothetical protein